jgi:hypothetical protein
LGAGLRILHRIIFARGWMSFDFTRHTALRFSINHQSVRGSPELYETASTQGGREQPMEMMHAGFARG